MSARYAWWGLLIQGAVEKIRPLVEAVMPAVLPDYKPDDVAFERGSGWTGVEAFVRDEPSFELADVLRGDGKREVVILDFGEVPWVHRWNGSGWVRAERETRQAAEAVGVRFPVDEPATRPLRHAELVEGMTADELKKMANDPRHVIDTPRGPVLLDEQHLYLDLAEIPHLRIYSVTRYLDNDDFRCSVTQNGDVAVFPAVVPASLGLRQLDAVDGETEPREIVRKLGIPEQHMFPT